MDAEPPDPAALLPPDGDRQRRRPPRGRRRRAGLGERRPWLVRARLDDDALDPDRWRAYLLTVAVVDDIVALLVIAIAYSGNVSMTALLIGIGLFGCILLIRAAGIHFGPVYFVFGTAVWVAFFKAGVDPVVAGLM